MHTQSPEVKEIALAAFPGYNGRKFEVREFHSMTLTSCWDSGCKDEYGFIHLESKQAYSVPENGTPWSNGGKILQCSELPMNVALVEYSRRGQHSWITIYLRPENMTKMLVEATGPALSEDERIVLIATRSFKSSYAGRSNNRFYEAKEATYITLAEWDAAQASLIEKGCLNKAGALTDAGRNNAGGCLDQFQPKVFYALNKEKKTVALVQGFEFWMQVQGAFRAGIQLPDGTCANGIGRSRSIEKFKKACSVSGFTILEETACHA